MLFIASAVVHANNCELCQCIEAFDLKVCGQDRSLALRRWQRYIKRMETAGYDSLMCWPLSRLKLPDVFRMPDEDWGQLCIPWWATQLAKWAIVGQSDDRHEMVGQ